MVDVVFLYRWHSSECLANLMMKYSCAVGGPKEQLLFSVQAFLGLEDTILRGNEGDLVEDLCPFKLVSDHLWGRDMVPGVLGSLIDGSCILGLGWA